MMKQSSNNIEPARPKEASLEAKGNHLTFSGNGKNKSVWQSYVDAPGFTKRHPDFFLKNKK